MFELMAGSGIIFLVFLLWKKRINFYDASFLIVVIFSMAFFAIKLTNELSNYNNVTFYNADLQVTIGIACINNEVMYKSKDSLSKTDYPWQIFNENTFKGNLPTKLQCKNNAFYNNDGKPLKYSEVIRIVTGYVNSGFLPFTYSNTGNNVDK